MSCFTAHTACLIHERIPTRLWRLRVAASLRRMPAEDSVNREEPSRRKLIGGCCLILSAMSLAYSSGLVPTFDRRVPLARRLLDDRGGDVPAPAAFRVRESGLVGRRDTDSHCAVQIFVEMTPITVGWRSRAPLRELNEFGFRGRSVVGDPQKPVVVLLGDSQVEAMAGTMEQMPEARLERYLAGQGIDARVCSLGTAGYGQDQQYFALREYLENHSADLIALWYTPGNDIWNNLFPTYMPANGAVKPTFRLIDDELKPPFLEWGSRNFSSPIKAIALLQRSRSRSLFEKRDELWETFLPPPNGPLKNWTGPVDDAWEDVPDYLSLILENLETEKSHFSIWLTPPSPRVKHGIRLTRRILMEIRSLAESHDARLVVFHAGQPLRTDGTERVFSLSGKHYRAAESQIERTVDQLAEGFDWIRLPVRLEDWRVSEVDSHLNAAANDDTMRRLAVELRSRIGAPAGD
jgi:hypothetical protein